MNRSKLHLAATLMALAMLPSTGMALQTTATMNVAALLDIPAGSMSVAGPLVFGTHVITGVPQLISASTTLDVTVSQGVPYTIQMDGGLNPAATTTSMQMLNATTGVLHAYALMTGADTWNRSVPTISGTGIGSAQTFDLQALTNTPTNSMQLGVSQAGDFQDTITLTLSF